jgi:hypothetical protein
MMKITAIVVLGLVAVAHAAVTIPSSCGRPSSGGGGAFNPNATETGGFDYMACNSGAGYGTQSIVCKGQDQGTALSFNYKTTEGDKDGTVFFQIVPNKETRTTTKFHIKASAPKQELLGFDYKQESDSSSVKAPVTSKYPLVSWVDATYMYNAPADTTLTFDVSCTGNTNTVTFSYGLYNSGAILEWEASSTDDNTVLHAQVTAGVPCCGPAEVSWALEGVDTEHVYINAKVTQTQGVWASATMDNVGFSIDDTQPFSNKGIGSATVRTCLTNQSCTTKAEAYYISALTAGKNDVDGFVTLDLTLKASAVAVGASVVTLAAVAVATLF